MPQPPEHSVQTDRTHVTSPRCGTGVHGQFWVQIERSSVSFHGSGERAVPAAPPIANARKLLLSIFIGYPFKARYAAQTLVENITRKKR
jgi:hypothetical protein